MTPTEVLMEVMEDFASSEPKDFVVVWNNSDHEVVLKSNSGAVEVLGLLEYAKEFVIEHRIRG